MIISTILASAIAWGASPCTTDDVIQVDKGIAAYEKTRGVSGTLSSLGSDTLNNLMNLWNEAFRAQYPSVQISVEGKGSATAPPALIEGTAQLGPMSRPMKSSEIDEFEEAFGYKPTAFSVAIDALAVYVHKDNPLEKATMAEIDAIFSQNRKLGHESDITTWGQLGLGGEYARRTLSMYGRNSASGTYGFFKTEALGKGDYKNTVKEQPGSASVVQGVESDRFGIGYSGIGYRTSGVKTLALAEEAGGPYFDTSAASVYSGKYPLSRALYIYVNKAPNQPLDPVIAEFLRFVLSKEGQEIVVKDGYLPLTAKLAKKEQAKL